MKLEEVIVANIEREDRNNARIVIEALMLGSKVTMGDETYVFW